MGSKKTANVLHLVRCKHSVQISRTETKQTTDGNGNWVNTPHEVVNKFEKDQLYFMVEHISGVSYSVFDIETTLGFNEHRSRDKHFNNELFVDDILLYDKPDFKTHFEIIKTYSDTLSSVKTKSRISNPDWDSWNRRGSEFLYGTFRLERHIGPETYSDVTQYVINVPGEEPIVGTKEKPEIGEHTTKYVTTELLLNLDLRLKHKNPLDKVDLSKSKRLKILEFYNQEYSSKEGYRNRDRSKVLDKLDMLKSDFKIPKSVKIVKLFGIELESLDRFKDLEKLDVQYSKVHKLSFKSLTNTKLSVGYIEFDEYDNLYWESVFTDKYHEYSCQIFKIDEDCFLCTQADRLLTREETQLMCATFQWHDAMKKFKFDTNQEFDFIAKDWYDKKEIRNQLYFFNDKKSIQMCVDKNRLQIFKEATFDWLSNRDFKFDIYIDMKTGKLGSMLDFPYDKHKTLDDGMLALILQVTDDPRFHKHFTRKFQNASNIGRSRFLGEIPIEDFKFSFIQEHLDSNEQQCVGIQLDKSKGWYMLINETVAKHGSSMRVTDGKVGYVGYNYKVDETNFYLIDFAKYNFKLSTENLIDGYTLMNHEDAHYYKNLRKVDRDDMIELEHGKLGLSKFDESIQYKFDLDSRRIEENTGFMVMNNKLFKHIGEHEKPFSFEYFYPERYNAKLSDAKQLAKLYGFKLDPSKIQFHEKGEQTYKLLQHINGSRDYTNYDTIFGIVINNCFKHETSRHNDYNLMYMSLFQNKQSHITNSIQTRMNFNSSFIRIGDKTYCFVYKRNEYKIYELTVVDQKVVFTNIAERNSSNDLKVDDIIGQQLGKHDNRFSYVNLEIPESLLRKLDQLIDDHQDMFKYFSQHSQFYLQKQLRCWSYIIDLFLEKETHLHYRLQDREKSRNSETIPKKVKDLIKKIISIREELNDPFVKLVQKQTNTKTTQLIPFQFVNKGEAYHSR